MMLELSDQKTRNILVAIYLDTQNRIIEQRTIFIGSVRRSIAEPRENSLLCMQKYGNISYYCP